MTVQCSETQAGQMVGIDKEDAMKALRQQSRNRLEAAAPPQGAKAKRSWTWIVLVIMMTGVAAAPWIWHSLDQPRWVIETLPLPPEPMPYPEGQAQPVKPVSAPEAVEPMAVTLTAQATTWIEVQADGRTESARVLAPGERYSFEAGEQARILVGNAGGTAVSLNGNTVGPLGGNGVARVVHISPDGFRILPKRSAI